MYLIKKLYLTIITYLWFICTLLHVKVIYSSRCQKWHEVVKYLEIIDFKPFSHYLMHYECKKPVYYYIFDQTAKGSAFQKRTFFQPVFVNPSTPPSLLFSNIPSPFSSTIPNILTAYPVSTKVHLLDGYLCIIINIIINIILLSSKCNTFKWSSYLYS